MISIKNAVFLTLSLSAAGMANAADWQEEWSVVKGQSIAKCEETFQNYQMQAICMDNEKAGYKEMQGD